MKQDVAPAEPADAAAAFEALRREVALLNVAVAGLAAERVPMPDYSETLGEIAKGVSVAVGRLGKVMSGPAFALSPADLARQIAVAGDEARRQDRATVHQAQEALQRSARDLEGWIDRARLASVQNWRLTQMGAVGILAGSLLGIALPGIVARSAPPLWLWPERMAAHTLRLDLRSAGDRMLQAAVIQRSRDPHNGALVVSQSREPITGHERHRLTRANKEPLRPLSASNSER